MKTLMKNLAALQVLEFGQDPTRRRSPHIDELRAQIPQSVLAHYDRLMARGKKAVVVVHGQICSGCHMRVPLASIMTLRHAEDIQLCDNCGRYLCLADEEETPAAPVKGRSGKAVAQRAPRPRRSTS
jgi:predicted  nucleic acid-binding Zn-ribbon protein